MNDSMMNTGDGEAVQAVLELLLYVKRARRGWSIAAEGGSFSPEARAFAIRRIDGLLAKMDRLEGKL